MKSVVVYKSKYGYTEKYAKFIAKNLDCDLFDVKDINPSSLKNYDTIIYGGGLYAGTISGISFITKNFSLIQNKKVIVFTVGLLHENMENINKSIDKIFESDLKNKISFFHLRGGINYKKLSMVHKIMMKGLYKFLSKKDPNELTDEDKQILEIYGKELDFTKEESAIDIINFAKTQ